MMTREAERGSPLVIVGRDGLGVGQVEGDAPGHAQLINGDVGVARNDRARRKVDALAHEVAPHSPLFPLQPLAD